MSARLGLRPPLPLALPKPHLHQAARPFSLPSLSDLSPTSPRTLRARRTLPYPPSLLYAIISDIPRYASFLPFCTSSVVHAWTATTPPLPSLATLTVGWGPFAAESYTSRVYCVPGSTVEAVSGRGAAGPSTAWDVLRRYGYDAKEAGGGPSRKTTVERRGGREEGPDGELFERLVTKWTVRPVEAGAAGNGDARTDVDLRIDYLMANPIHQVAVGGMADQVAEKMIRAFEARAEELYTRSKARDVGAR